MRLFKKHPFAVTAHFKSSIVLTFAVKKEKLENMIPECLELDLFQDKYAFIAAAFVQTKKLRPKGFPEFLGNDFFLIGYRVFVKYRSEKGKRLRGLYILKSQTDKKKMEFFGNIFTYYNYSTTDISTSIDDNVVRMFSEKSKVNITYEEKINDVKLPINSPFESWKEARRYAGPLPFTFTYDEKKREVLIIEGVRKNWKPTPLKINDYKLPFVENITDSKAVLANAFIVNNIPYTWKKGYVELWK